MRQQRIEKKHPNAIEDVYKAVKKHGPLSSRELEKYDRESKRLSVLAYYREPSVLAYTHPKIEAALQRFLRYWGGERLIT